MNSRFACACFPVTPFVRRTFKLMALNAKQKGSGREGAAALCVRCPSCEQESLSFS